jgi:glycosyltransferase involved in cell wall biosynthesis
MPQRLVVDARLLHYNRTGIGRYLGHLYRAMGELAVAGDLPDGLEVHPLYHRKDAERHLRSHWHPAHVAWTPPHHRWERWTLAAELARLRPALVHSPDHVCPQPLGWRAVLTVHDLAFWRLPDTHALESRRYYDGLRRSVEQATRIICVSDATRRDLVDLAGAAPEKIRVVHEAPDPAYTLPPAGSNGYVSPPGSASRRPYFVFVGTIEPRKNVAGIIRALADVLHTFGPKRQQERPELVVAGADGPGSFEVKALPRRLGIERDVRFLGRVPTVEVVALYRDALALVYPSLLEGFGLPILEAMASGAPVITSDRSSMPEVAGDAALLVDPVSEADLSSAMRRLLEDEACRRQLRKLGFARAAQFNWHQTARQTLAVFQEALGA